MIGAILAVILMAVVLIVLEQKLYEKLWNRNLTVSLEFAEDAIYEGEKGSLKEVIENRKPLPISMLNVRFDTDRNLDFDGDKGQITTDKFYRNDVFMIKGQEKVTRTLKFKGLHRGVYGISEVGLAATDVFMMSRLSADEKVSTSIYVYPRPFESEAFLNSFRQLYGDLLTRRHLLEDPFEYRGVRDYQPYDSMRTINWKKTAQTGSLKVNQKNYTTQKSIRIFMNLEDSGILKREESVEAAIRIAVSLSRLFLEQGMQVSIFCNAVDLFTKEPVICAANAGAKQYRVILRALTRCDIGNVHSFVDTFGKILMNHEKDGYTCLISPNQYRDFVDIVKALHHAKAQYMWFYPVWELADPGIDEEIRRNVRFLHIR